MSTTNDAKRKTEILTMQEWIDLELTEDERAIILGTPERPIVKPRTKNLIQAPEKACKTTFLLRLMAGLSCGQTVFPQLPVTSARKVLYLHGELSKPDIKDRTQSASKDLKPPFANLLQGRFIDGHLIDENGQRLIRETVEEHKPDDLVLDPWQSFICGTNENDFTEVSTAMKFCDQLIDDFGVTLWIPIHLGKDHGRGPRGHSSVMGWRDTAITLKKTGSTVDVWVQPRWGSQPDRFSLQFSDGTLVSPANPILRGQTADIQDFVRKLGGTATREQLVKAFGKKEDTIRKALDRAREVGAIEFDEISVWLPKQGLQDVLQ